MIKYERYISENTHVRMQDGNKKLGKGIYTINLLAGDKPLTLKDGTQLTNVAGTCGGCCDACQHNCYAIKNQIYRNANIPTWADNTLLALHDQETFFNDIQNSINKNMVSAIRFHGFGEIPNFNYLYKMAQLAINNPDVKFYTYTKRFLWLEKYIDCFGDFPKNLVINVSIWHGNYSNKYNFPAFIYDDGTEKDLQNVKHCPAVDKNGRETGITCAMCKHCINAKHGDVMAVYAH